MLHAWFLLPEIVSNDETKTSNFRPVQMSIASPNCRQITFLLTRLGLRQRNWKVRISGFRETQPSCRRTRYQRMARIRLSLTRQKGFPSPASRISHDPSKSILNYLEMLPVAVIHCALGLFFKTIRRILENLIKWKSYNGDSHPLHTLTRFPQFIRDFSF